MSDRSHRPIAALLVNIGVLVAGMLAMVGIFYGAAALGVETPARHIAEAFDDGTLSEDVARILEPVPGFIVMESDYEGACTSYSHMLSPSSALFGLGMAPDPFIYPMCRSLNATVHGPLGQNYGQYYRYWQGAAAFNRIALTFLSVFWWQVVLTALLLVLIAAFVWRLTRYSRTLAVGTAVVCLSVVDFPWQGMAPLHGISSAFGFTFALVTLTAFDREWTARWGLAVLAGATYAMVAHTLVPMAFAILVAMTAMAPLLTARQRPRARAMAVGAAVGLLWALGYALGTASRLVWAAIWGPGLDEALREWTGTGEGFMIRTWIDPFYQFIGLMGKTWLVVGFMQVGLMVFFAVVGWSLAKGGARGARERLPWIALSPVLLGIGWMIVWAVHSNHTYVHAVPGMMILLVLFASEVGRACCRWDEGTPAYELAGAATVPPSADGVTSLRAE